MHSSSSVYDALIIMIIIIMIIITVQLRRWRRKEASAQAGLMGRQLEVKIDIICFEIL